jgi:uncharacterized protein (TIGR00645 family)
MIAAIVFAMAMMLMASAAFAGFIERHESVRMLALSFLLLIGMMLVADGFGMHIPRRLRLCRHGLLSSGGNAEPSGCTPEHQPKEKGERGRPCGDQRPMTTMQPISQQPPISRHNLPERIIEWIIFGSRWLLAPIYLGLSVGLVVLVIKFGQHAVELLSHVTTADVDATTVGILALIDLALMGSLVLMVMFAGYENFVSKLDLVGHKDKPSWMGHVDFSDLKLKLMASIVAISAIHVLGSFMNIERLSDRSLAWSVGIHMAFVVSGVLLAIMDRLTGKTHP